MSQEITEMVIKFEQQTQNNITTSIRGINSLREELSYLDAALLRYARGRTGTTLTVSEKRQKMADIRERIVEINKTIAYYRECITADEKEIDRLYRDYEPYIIYDEDY